MHKYLLAAAAVAALASPAAARDGQPYVGVEGGLVFANHEDFDFYLGYPAGPAPGGTTVAYGNNDVHFRPGVDLDVIAGYDFGMFRIEGELAWKSIHTRDFGVNDNNVLLSDFAEFYGSTAAEFETDFDADLETVLAIPDHATIASLMVNGLVDFDAGGLGFYAGVGAGRARVKMFDDRDSAWALQGILGVRAPISERVDVGLKYRYFRTGNLNFDTTLLYPEVYTGDTFGFGASGRISTHSLLGSLIFNLGAPAQPVYVAPVVVPEAPLPPATQTCPDGSVILATDVCPVPPPPPPPPHPRPSLPRATHPSSGTPVAALRAHDHE